MLDKKVERGYNDKKAASSNSFFKIGNTIQGRSAEVKYEIFEKDNGGCTGLDHGVFV